MPIAKDFVSKPYLPSWGKVKLTVAQAQAKFEADERERIAALEEMRAAALDNIELVTANIDRLSGDE